MTDLKKYRRGNIRTDTTLFSKTISPGFAVNSDTRKKKVVKRLLKRMAQEHLAQNRKQLAVFAFDIIGAQINVYGIYEKFELDLLFEWLSPYHHIFKSSAVIDIGANIGNHSLYFSDYFSKVFSFEPNPRTYKVLALNSELATNIECFNFGISNRSERAVLHTPQHDIGRSSIKNPVNSDDAWQPSEIILERFDDVFVSDLRVSLIKIDVEGLEYQVLEGAEASLKNDQPIILFEQHDEDFSDGTSKCIDLLKKYGYRKFASIDRKYEPNRHYPRFLRNLIHWISPRLFGVTYEIAVHPKFVHRFHNFIIAIPDWVNA